VVFLKGCRLDCPWCHNLEGKSFKPQIAFNGSSCIGCGLCLEACPRRWPSSPADAWRAGCTACGRCAEACPAQARRLVGTEYGPEELAELVTDDIDFLQGTGGGITFSGGEPLAQPRFLFAAARVLKKRGLHLAVETSGFWPPKLVGDLVRWFDLVIFDVKHVDPRKFRKATGRDNKVILGNLGRLIASRAAMELRLPLIPGFNDGEADLLAIARWLKRHPPVAPLRILPFHRLAAAKQASLGLPYPFASAPLQTKEEIEAAARLLAGEGIPVL
jgi:pyruvate formate lyase activating enzyme